MLHTVHDTHGSTYHVARSTQRIAHGMLQHPAAQTACIGRGKGKGSRAGGQGAGAKEAGGEQAEAQGAAAPAAGSKPIVVLVKMMTEAFSVAVAGVGRLAAVTIVFVLDRKATSGFADKSIQTRFALVRDARRARPSTLARYGIERVF